MPFSPPAVRCRDVIVEQMITPSGPAQKTICCGAHAAGIPRLTQHRANLSNPAKVMFGPYDYIFLAGCFAGRRTSTTLADLFTLLFAANPFSAAWASLWRWSSDEFEDGLAHGGQCRSRRRPVDSFFPALLF